MKSIFVSSTFRDFQYERDVLQKQVLPALNLRAKEFGETVDLCDLRWGVDTTEMNERKSSHALLSICLDEIDRCRPWMIVLLGGRYGYVPGSDAISRELRTREDFSLRDLEISVTQLEIEYGALKGDLSGEHVFFYMRELSGESLPDDYRDFDPAAAARLEELKQRIQALAGGRVHTYKANWDGAAVTGLDEFAELVAADLLSELEPGWKELSALNVYEREKRIQQNVFGEKTRAFVYPEKTGKLMSAAASAVVKRVLPKEFRQVYISDKEDRELIRRLKSYIRVEDTARELEADVINFTKLLGALTGINSLDDQYNFSGDRAEDGSGKTIFCVHLAKVLECMGWIVIPVLCGTSTLSSGPEGVLRYVTYRIEELCRQPHRDLDTLTNAACRSYCNALIQKKLDFDGHRMILIVDGVDHLEATALRDSLEFLPNQMNRMFRIYMTFGPDFHFSYGRNDYPMSTAFVPARFRYTLVDHISRGYGKRLTDEVAEAICSKEAGGNPLYLRMMIDRLCMMDEEDFSAISRMGEGIAAITAYQRQIIADLPENPGAMACALLEAAAGKAGSPELMTAMEYLAFSHKGLRGSDLIALAAEDKVPLTSLSLHRFMNYLNEYFLIREDGRYDFSHQLFGRSLAAASRHPEETLRKLSAYLKSLPDDDPVKAAEYLPVLCRTGNCREILGSFSYALAAPSEYVAEGARTYAAFLMEHRNEFLPAMENFLQDQGTPEESVIALSSYMTEQLFGAFGEGLKADQTKILWLDSLRLSLMKRIGDKTDPVRLRNYNTVMYRFLQLALDLGPEKILQKAIDCGNLILKNTGILIERAGGLQAAEEEDLRMRALACAGILHIYYRSPALADRSRWDGYREECILLYKHFAGRLAEADQKGQIRIHTLLGELLRADGEYLYDHGRYPEAQGAYSRSIREYRLVFEYYRTTGANGRRAAIDESILQVMLLRMEAALKMNRRFEEMGDDYSISSLTKRLNILSAEENRSRWTFIAARAHYHTARDYMMAYLDAKELRKRARYCGLALTEFDCARKLLKSLTSSYHYPKASFQLAEVDFMMAYCISKMDKSFLTHPQAQQEDLIKEGDAQLLRLKDFWKFPGQDNLGKKLNR